MTTSLTSPTLRRADYLALTAAALAQGNLRFTRAAILSWLAAYPGDLEAGLLYARVLLAEGRSSQAAPILAGLTAADPEDLAAQTALAELRQRSENPEAALSWTTAAALGAMPPAGVRLAAWGADLLTARRSLEAGAWEAAEAAVRAALGAEAPTPLAAVYHLRYLAAVPGAPLAARRALAELYHDRWPDCLAARLHLADWMMEGGETAAAVDLLHGAAGRDVGGQVARRVWRRREYAALWPERLELTLDLPIPGELLAAMGWNRLPAQTTRAQAKIVPPSLADDEAVPAVSDSEPQVYAGSLEAPLPPFFPRGEDDRRAVYTADFGPEAKSVPTPIVSEPPVGRDPHAELERLAARLHQPGPTRQDGRFPVYVIFSTRRKLEAAYGTLGFAAVETEMKALAAAVAGRHSAQFHWGARVFLADDPSCTAPLGIKPADANDPWALKLALVDLDAALGRNGQMIGAVLIVGGPEIVPFHHLPNPTDDQDLDVPSDNPYASRDENYFIPEWPLGRVAGGVGADPRLLTAALRVIAADHRERGVARRGWARWIAGLLARLRGRRTPQMSFVFSAAPWREMSLQVTRPLGRPGSVTVAPPASGFGANGQAALPSARLQFYNLHGIMDGADWYGQRPAGDGEGVQFPVALRPQDVTAAPGAPAPEVIFSEACFGAHLSGRRADESIALRFLAAGVGALVGSTCTAYGAIGGGADGKLLAADLLAYTFWQKAREGWPVGEALRHAKMELARQMHKRQGYLDGEDQKTLLSFILLGDPLRVTEGRGYQARAIYRTVRPPATVKTVCDRMEGDGAAPSGEDLEQVKAVVRRYLPGMADAEMRMSYEHATCAGPDHVCPTRQFQGKTRPKRTPERRLVTLSKQVPLAGAAHFQVARLTLDAEGQLVKLVVSR